MNGEEAKALFAEQPYKIELINDILKGGTDEYGEPLPEGETPKLTTFKQDKFEDLCRGPACGVDERDQSAGVQGAAYGGCVLAGR